MTCRIDPSTKIFGVTGYPLSHTYSPVIHNYLFERYGINAVYLVFPAEPGKFSKLMAALKTIGVAGFNITVPYKRDVIRYCDSLDPIAEQIGAVNTVVEKNGSWHGAVTDPEGFRKAIAVAFKGFVPGGKRILVLGAGGSAQSVVHSSLSQGAVEVVVMNRTLANARALVSRMKKIGAGKCSVKAYDRKLLAKDDRFDLIVNCTSVGLKKGDPCILDLEDARKGTRVYDLIYNPAVTPLLAEAVKRGLANSNGLGMLVHQAFASFKKWTGIEPDLKDAEMLMKRLGIIETTSKRRS